MITETLTYHTVVIDERPLNKQVRNEDFGGLVNYFKRNPLQQTKNLKEILTLFSKGHNIILSDVNIVDAPGYSLDKDISFVSSDIFAIDIDDEAGEKEPLEVWRKQGGKAVGMFYTFSHGIKGNRYRLIYQLDEKVTNDNELKAIMEIVQEDLIEQGVPGVDKQANNPTMPVRGGRLGYRLHERPRKLNTKKMLSQVRKNLKNRKKALIERAMELEDTILPPFEALKEAAEKIGYLPSGAGVGDEWLRITYGLRYAADIGQLTDDEGFELYSIISGKEASRRVWDTYKNRADGRATIGSFIDYAKRKGYHFKYSYENEKPIEQAYKSEQIEIKNYIQKDDAKKLLKEGQRLLVDSSTGSGKTTAFMNAMKELASDDVSESNVYILSVPTRALVDQQSRQHKTLPVKSGDSRMFQIGGTLQEYIEQGNRVIVSTYDMTSRVIRFLKNHYKNLRYSIVVDEIHKFVTDYSRSFRYLAIRSLENISREVEVLSFIGLSGTPDELFKNEFDKVIEFKKENKASPAEDYFVFTYKDRRNELPYLIQLIKAYVNRRKRLLVFIQSKRAIQQVEKILSSNSINVASLTADDKNKDMYKELIEKETIKEDVDVILSTTVIADGINIINNSGEWGVITVSSTTSNLFNVNTIRQMSNRLRNPYHFHAIYTQEPKHEQNGTKSQYHLERAFAYRLNRSKELVKEVNKFIQVSPDSFLEGIVERERGVYLKNDEYIEIDHTHVRHQTVMDREYYYRLYRESFVQAVSESLGIPITQRSSIDDLIERNVLGQDFLDTLTQSEKATEETKLSDEEKKNNIKELFTFDVYDAYQAGNSRAIEEFEKKVLPMHSACIKGICNLFNYDVCYQTVINVQRNADTHLLRNEIRYMMDYCYNQIYGLRTKTWRILNDLLQINEFIPNSEYREEISRIARNRKVSIKEVKKVEKMVDIVRKRTGNSRLRKVQGKTFPRLAEKHGITIREVINAMERLTEREVLRGKQKSRMKKVVNIAKEDYKKLESRKIG